jgi:hypothetical protein
MGLLRKSTISLAHLLLFTSLASFGVGLAILHTFGQPGPLERALGQTNIYSDIVTNFIQSHQDSTTIGIPLNIPAVQTAVQQALPNNVIEPAANQLISSVYSWMQGKTPNLAFQIDLTTARVNLANGIQQIAEQQAATLPTCSYSQLFANPALATQNPLAATCLPPGITPTIVGSDAKQVILASKFLKSPLTPQTLGIANNNQLKLPVDKNKSVSLPHLYHELIESLYGSLVVAIASAATMIWLYRDHLKGIRRVGGTLGWVGALCLVDAFITGEIPHWLKSVTVSSSGQQVTDSLQQSITKVVTILVDEIHQWLLWYGIVLFVVGAGTWLGILLWQRKQKPSTPVAETPHTPENPVTIS